MDFDRIDRVTFINYQQLLNIAKKKQFCCIYVNCKLIKSKFNDKFRANFVGLKKFKMNVFHFNQMSCHFHSANKKRTRQRKKNCHGNPLFENHILISKVISFFISGCAYTHTLRQYTYLNVLLSCLIERSFQK